jgi:hypothetical protein
LKKKLQLKKKLNFFGSKTTIYLSLGLHKELSSYRRSLQLSKEVIQHFKTRTFKFFLLLWVIFALLDPDPDPLTRLNPDPDRYCSGSATLDEGSFVVLAVSPEERSELELEEPHTELAARYVDSNLGIEKGCMKKSGKQP